MLGVLSGKIARGTGKELWRIKCQSKPDKNYKKKPQPQHQSKLNTTTNAYWISSVY